MSFNVAGLQSEGYVISTEVFSGPLDLLLELIEHAELDITTLALAQVTNQFLSYLNSLNDRNPEEVSAFIVIASRLLQIKSNALLPRSTVSDKDGEDEDPGETLVQQLILYKRFKEISGILKFHQEKGLRTYLRINGISPKVEPKLDMEGLTTEDLRVAAKSAFSIKTILPQLSQVVSMPRVSIREKISSIMTALETQGDNTTFQKFLLNYSRLPKEMALIEVVVSFFALLELIKRKVIDVQQSGIFEDIQLLRMKEWENGKESEEFEFID